MKKILIPPISTRLHEGFSSKCSWLANYYEFRDYNQDSPDFQSDAKNLLSSMGKNNSDLADKFRGTLLGLAIGDAFSPPLKLAKTGNTEIIRDNSKKLKTGQWTVNTSMALCLAHSLYGENFFDPDDQMMLYTLCWKEGFLNPPGEIFNISSTVSNALIKYEQSKTPYSEHTDEYPIDNGALIRLAPVPLFYASTPETAIEMSGLSSKTTHANIQSIDACRYFSGLILGAIKGVTKKTLLSPMYSPLEGLWQAQPLCEPVQRVAAGAFKNRLHSEIKLDNHVTHSLEAALWLFYNTSSFEEGLIKASGLSSDSSAITAIYGQLAGAFYGELAIPFSRIAPLKNYHYFYFFADEFVTYYTGRSEFLAFDGA